MESVTLIPTRPNSSSGHEDLPQETHQDLDGDLRPHPPPRHVSWPTNMCRHRCSPSGPLLMIRISNHTYSQMLAPPPTPRPPVNWSPSEDAAGWTGHRFLAGECKQRAKHAASWKFSRENIQTSCLGLFPRRTHEKKLHCH